MKKILSIFVLIFGLIFITSCANKDKNENPDSGNTPAATTSVISVYDEEMNLVNKYSYSATVDNTIDVTAFEKPGYKFEGIYDMNLGIMLFNAKGYQAPTVMFDTNYTAVLKYSPITYQLVFEARDGQLLNPSDYIKTVSYGEILGLFPEPTLDGMTFDGWFDENGTRLSFGTSPVYTKLTSEGFNLSSEVIKLYAQYSTKYCNVRLMYQDGSSDIQIKVQYGQKLPDLSAYYKDAGSRSVVGFGASPNATVSFEDPVYTDLELYALWKDYKLVSFVYTDTETKLVKVYRDGSLATLPEGERRGYDFEGWYTSELLSGSKVTTVSFGTLADVYYAKWSVGTYTIRFVADGNLVGTSTYSIDKTDVFIPPVPFKSHYSGEWESFELNYTDLTVNAIYTPEIIKITLLTGSEYSYFTLNYGESFELPVPIKTGYEFGGWYYKENPVTDRNGASLAPYYFDGTITLTAKWSGIKCQLYFETHGGSAISSVTVDYGTPYTFTEVPTRDGYFFAGWYDGTLTNEYIDTITITQDTIVHAKWIKSTPIYDADGLKAIANNPYGNYHLMANINLKSEEWTPIDNFYGILNGNGYKIYNFTLRKNGVDLGFIVNNSGTIKDITFAGIELSNTVSGNISCAISAVCARNSGKILHVTAEKVNMLVNVSSVNANNTICIGAIVGDNTGVILSCTAESELVYKEDVQVSMENGSCATYMFLGGIVGKNTANVTNVNADFTVDVNEFVYAYADATHISNAATKYAHLNIGGITGGEYGQLTNAESTLSCTLYSNANGTNMNYYAAYHPARYTSIGGAVGAAYESAVIEKVSAHGNMTLERVGLEATAYEFAIGGVIGKIANGSVSNCISDVDISIKPSYAGTVGGIAGYVAADGKAVNVAYYGNITTTSALSGYFGGLAGRVDGALTKGYFNGKILTDSTAIADIAGYIANTGSVSKTISNGNVKKIYAAGEGSAKNNYIVDVDYGSDILFSVEMLFDELYMFEADIWGIDEEAGLYLLAFPIPSATGELSNE